MEEPIGTWKYRKPEPSNVRGLCVACGKNPQKKKSNGKYRALCGTCDKRFYYRMYGRTKPLIPKKCICTICKFEGHYSQFDIDHIDGNHSNNNPSNLQELCANCHRLKTFQNRDWEPSG